MHLSLYNDLIAMAFGGLYDGSSTFSYSMVVSYPNSTDFSIDITDNLISFVNPIIKLYEKCNIENNIFGYLFSGYIIYNFTKGLKLLESQSQDEISKEEILSNNTDIELILNNEINIQESGRIEYGMVVMEPEYESYNQYPNEILINYCGDNCDDEKDYFPKQNYFGRVSYCDITFNIDQITSTDCDENYIVCIKGSDKKCIVCR